jgi:hypothetical protein
VNRPNDTSRAPTAPRACRICSCTEDNCEACFARTGEPCFWVERDLCSACAPPDQVSKMRVLGLVAGVVDGLSQVAQLLEEFAGFAALPPGDPNVPPPTPAERPWREVLDVPIDGWTSGAPPAAVLAYARTRHRELIKLHHPDRGGDQAIAAAINRALDQAEAELGRWNVITAELSEAGTIALRAIRHVLDRACDTSGRDQLGRHISPLTESWGRLVAAEAALLGVDRPAHAAWRDALYERAGYAIAERAWRDAEGEELAESRLLRDGTERPDPADVAASRVRLEIADAWRQHVGGARPDVLVACGEGKATSTAPAAVVRRVGVWALLRYEDKGEGATVWSITHGPSGLAAAGDECPNAERLAILAGLDEVTRRSLGASSRDPSPATIEATMLEHLAAIEQLGGRALDGSDNNAVGALLRSRGAI